jgi:hypothetical protein
MATRSQSLPEWLDCHVRMYEWFGGVSALTVLDFVAGNKIGLLCPTPLCARPDG